MPPALACRCNWIRWNCIGLANGVPAGWRVSVDAVKAIMTGAHAVQVVSSLLQNGPGYLKQMRQGLAEWLEKHEYTSLQQMQGSMNLLRCPDPKAFERANYMMMLQSWKP